MLYFSETAWTLPDIMAVNEPLTVNVTRQNTRRRSERSSIAIATGQPKPPNPILTRGMKPYRQ